MSTPSLPATPRLSFVLLLFALLLSLPRAARAAPVDLADLDPDQRDDAALHERWTDGASSGSLWLSLQAQLVRRADGRSELGALVLLGVPLERLSRPRLPRLPMLAEGPSPLPAGTRPPLPPPAGAPVPAPPLIDTTALPLPVTPEMARAAVAAALVEARLSDPEVSLDRLASRARNAALLPELRLRVMRQLDQTQSLSPTEYDPDRVTSSGGTSLWLEARATWRLDRLVFADEEIALERMRRERAEAQTRLVRRVLDLLFAWQKALVARDDPDRDPEARLRAVLAAVEAEAALDVATGGWFSRWRKSAP
jgi:hypothetical protein